MILTPLFPLLIKARNHKLIWTFFLKH